MCYAIPGRVEKIDGTTVTVSYFGELKKARNEFIEIAPGDYVYAQGGYVIQRLSADKAEAILATWKEEFFELQDVDVRLSRLDLERKNIGRGVLRILDRALEQKPLAREELLSLLAIEEPAELDLLFKTANFLRRKHLGNSCCVHGIIEISNLCGRNCAYCGISTHNRELPRYRMSREEILRAIREAVVDHGFKALVLQSGEEAGYSVDELASIIRQAREEHPVLIFVSFGEVGADGLRTLYDAGARGLLLRFETSNPALYAKLHPGYSLETRLADLRAACDMGYLLLTGGLIGLPGQTPEDILDDVLLAHDLKAEMFSFGPCLPHPATPLKELKPPDESLILKTLAVGRIVDTNAKILVTTGFETLSPAARKKGLLAGANSVMLNVTPMQYRRLYSIYPNRAHEDEELPRQIDETIALLRSLGRAPTDLGI